MKVRNTKINKQKNNLLKSLWTFGAFGNFRIFWILCFLSGMSSVSFLHSGVNKTTVFDTPTALSMDKGEFEVDAFFYRDGGLLTKVAVGINKYINLGVMEYSDGLIGFSDSKWSIPSVSVKIRFTDVEEDSHNVAIGFDSFFNGSFSSHPGNYIYGLYAVYSKGFYLGESFDQPSIFSVGIRHPLIYQTGQPSVFASLYLSFFKVFDFSTEIENLHFAKQYEYYFIFNNTLIFKLVDEVAINIVLQLAMEETEKSVFQFGRALRITFNSTF